MTASDMPGDAMVSIYGAREHNLQSLTLHFPQHRLIVITGLSGSGKSSLAFDTLYAEGQYRYTQTFSAYARSFIGELQRPDVDEIEGLSPVIAIEQKSTHNNPRSTVGTSTEIYDFLRVLYARIGRGYSSKTGKAFEKSGVQAILSQLERRYNGLTISLLAPLVRGRKGHYKELFAQLYKQGYLKVYVDGKLQKLRAEMQVDRFCSHEIAVVVDHVPTEEGERLEESLETALKKGKGTCMVLSDEDSAPVYLSTHLSDPDTGLTYETPSPNTFSFNTLQGMCPSCRGLGHKKSLNAEVVMPDKTLSIAQGGITVLGRAKDSSNFRILQHILYGHGYSLKTPLNAMSEKMVLQLLYGSDRNKTNDFEIKGHETITDLIENRGILGLLVRMQHNGLRCEQYLLSSTCESCQGRRLRPESLLFKVGKKDISEVTSMPLPTLRQWITELGSQLTDRELQIARELLREIATRSGLLIDLGLHYLTLSRSLDSLSGGEAQRARLSTQIGNQLVGVMYILDEPSIGLHPRDNDRLIQSLKRLRDMGNTVVVVEHDKDIMLQSDYLIDMGPGAGTQGGKIVAQGTPQEVLATNTLTAQYLNNKKRIPQPAKRRSSDQGALELLGACGFNLKKPHFQLPLRRLVCLTGVSGSGKSTLIHHTLIPILKQRFYGATRKKPLPYADLRGIELIDKVIEVNQRPIGRTPRSNPATYTGIFGDIRLLYAQLPEARLRGYGPGRFSFNVAEGRCPTCRGGGMRLIEMSFLPDMYVSCETCLSKRYNEDTLKVLYKEASISDVLEMPISEARTFFEEHPKMKKKLQTLCDVGLGYLTLGQHATTLSGGEAQRIKLATELLRRDTGRTLYVLDEPTTGLHFEDIARLLNILQKLVDKGNSVLVIEHNLEVIACCDYLIDLGPEGGAEGGNIVDQGTPEEVAKRMKGLTAKYLSKPQHLH